MVNMKKPNKIDRKKELLSALRTLGRGIKEKGYTKNKLIDFCMKVRKVVYNKMKS